MSWFVVGGIAIGATAGAIVGSKKGGDDVWKDALIGGAIGGVGAGVGAAAFAPAAEAAVPAAVGAEGGAGILGAGEIAGSGLALGGAGLETGGAMAGGASGAGIVGAEGAATGAGAGGMGLGQAGGFGSGASFGGSGTSFGAYGGAAVPEGGGLMNAGFAPGMQAPIQMIEAPAATEYAMWGGDEATNVAANTPKTPTKSPLEKGFGSAMSWLSEPKNAMLTGVLGLGALSMFNQDNEDNFGGSTVTPAGYPLSPNFKPSRYQPTRTYAIGGPVQSGMYPQSQIPDRTQFATPTQMPASMEVLRSDYDSTINPYTGDETRFKTGGSASDNSDKAFAEARRYQGMIDPRMNVQTPDTPDWVRSRGVYHDEDPDTKYQDALTAAQTRMGKAASRASVKLGAMQKPTPLGKLNLGPVAGREKEEEEVRAASGGIASLGGYAHGGNPRLLRGPGDGMSDDIPATIADKQPARLADGEFVVPADVVSGLGNGSTEAGAKKLHQMMDKVRVDRTGTKKQGKEIDADKYIPGAKAKKKAAGGIASYADGGNVDYSQYYVYDAAGNQVPMSALLNTTQTQTAPVSPKANTTAQGYNPDYYNPQYYQSQANTLQDRLAAQNQNLTNWQNNLNALNTQGAQMGQYLGGEGQTITGTPGQQVAYGANGRYAYGTIGEGGTLDLSNAVFGDPIVGTYKHGYAYNPQGYTPEQYQQAQGMIGDINAEIAKTQGELSPIQQNIARLEQSGIKYDPYTIANRPSSAEPQFYGNIYQPEYVDYARPGYNMNAQLGAWNNEYGSDGMPTQRQQNIAQLAQDQRLAQAEQFANSQRAAQTSRQLINASVAAGKNQPPQEKQARKGGILAAKRK